MLKPIVMFGAALLFVTSATVGLTVPGKFQDSLTLLRPALVVDEAFLREVRTDFLRGANEVRSQFGISTLGRDGEIEAFLVGCLEAEEAPERSELNVIFDRLQQRYPGAQYLAANLVTAGSREELVGQLCDWDELGHPEFHDLSLAVVALGRRMTALAVLSRRIPRFDLAVANESGGRFYNVCPHDGSIHALELDRKTKTLILSCPDCERPYDVLAADSEGRMRRAVDFFTEFQLPRVSASLSPKEQVLAIWRKVAARCRYEHDHAGHDQTEVWKTSDETWFSREGDCEDTSILLVDVLISAGFEARVAIGWNGNIGQHAWVVVDLEGAEYVIESTIQEQPELHDFMPVAEAAPFYRPEQLFDRDYLYYHEEESGGEAAHYFADGVWKRIAW